MTTTAELTAKRVAAITEILTGSVATSFNEYKVPETPSRFLVVEKSDGDIVWAQDEDSLEACGRYLESSDTERTSAVAFDLDTPDENAIDGVKTYVPCYKITSWLEV